ncbi:MAG: hypothetical protein ACLVC5_09385 [Clostridia bacterium]
MENEKEVRSRMTLYDEWVRTATALEKYKKKLEESEKARQAEKQQAEAEKKRAEAEKKQAEAEKQLLEYLLDQDRIDDLKKSMKDSAYKEALLRELKM